MNRLYPYLSLLFHEHYHALYNSGRQLAEERIFHLNVEVKLITRKTILKIIKNTPNWHKVKLIILKIVKNLRDLFYDYCDLA